MEIGTKVKYYWDCMAGKIIKIGTISRIYTENRYEVRTENGWSAISKEDIIEVITQ